uniref:SPASM domain-containing protein n=1 Tax=Thelazia callipaeda TaxID=103827 RepID=A0A0N5D9E5_THECL
LNLSKKFQAFNNFYNYLRDITISEKQCGQCSYQQSCGRQCHRRGTIDVINPLFVAERICTEHDQSSACESKFVENCKLWPNANVYLPNVTQTMQELIDKIDYLTCIPQIKFRSTFELNHFHSRMLFRINGEKVCRCCCHPYVPNAATMQCELKPYLVRNQQQYLYEKVQDITD